MNTYTWHQIILKLRHIHDSDALHIYPDFFGANEAITNYETGRDDWIATLIVAEKNMEAAWDKRNKIIADIKKRFQLEGFRDSAPQD